MAYALPWSYVPPAEMSTFQKRDVQFLEQVAEYMPVLKDPRLGADPVLAHFGDSPLHPNVVGATLHTDELAGEIKSWDCWTAEELRNLESAS